VVTHSTWHGWVSISFSLPFRATLTATLSSLWVCDLDFRGHGVQIEATSGFTEWSENLRTERLGAAPSSKKCRVARHPGVRRHLDQLIGIELAIPLHLWASSERLKAIRGFGLNIE
jgi:hypothetical protein